MMTGDFQDPDFGEVEGPVPPLREVPEKLRYLDLEARAQKISLTKLFAEQEHGLRQKYADWIIWMLGAQFVIADGVFVVLRGPGSAGS